MVTSPTFFRENPQGGRTFFNAHDLEWKQVGDEKVPYAQDGEPVCQGPVEKMSKSKNNGVSPERLIQHYGADAVRLFALFAAPVEQALEWSEKGVNGMQRFLKRVDQQITECSLGVNKDTNIPSMVEVGAFTTTHEHSELWVAYQTCLKEVSGHMDKRSFNVAIAKIMEFVNHLSGIQKKEVSLSLLQEYWSGVTLMLNPFAPHHAHHWWQKLHRIHHP
jgi:leucyl-tRNA synthetase